MRIKILALLVALMVGAGIQTALTPAPAAAVVTKCTTFSHYQYIYDKYINSHYTLASVHMSGRICGTVPGKIIPSLSYVIADVEDATAAHWSGLHTWSRGVYVLGYGTDYAGTSNEKSYIVERVYFGSKLCWTVSFGQVCNSSAYYHASFRLYSSKYGIQYFVWTTGLVGENTPGNDYHFYL